MQVMRRILTIVALPALCACQPVLHPKLPAGQAGYDAIALSPEEANPPAYLLQAGDRVNIQVYEEPELSATGAQVDASGDLHLPLIGRVEAAGRSQSELALDIERAYGQNFLRKPQVNVAVVEAMPGSVAVEGEVKLPGVYELKQGSTLLAALARAQSPTRTAKLDQILIFRTVNGQRMGARFNLTDIRSGLVPDPQVHDGDVVVVGFSAVKGLYEDLLRAAPIFNLFVLLDRNNR